MTTRRVDVWTGVLLLVALVLQLTLYLQFNAQPDGFNPTLPVMLVPPIAVAAIWLWIHVWIKHLPADASTPSVRRQLRYIQILVAAGIAAMPLHSVLTNIGIPMPRGVLGLVVIGALIVAFGNRMSKLRKNASVGIRNTWTLADDEVWLRTHRLLGRVLVGGGTSLIAVALLRADYQWAHAAVAALVAALLAVRFYSFWVYRQLNPTQA